MNEVTECKYCLEAGKCTGLCSDAAELAAKSYDAGYEKGSKDSDADYEKRFRDNLISVALNGLLTFDGNRYFSHVASDAVEYADAVLEARK